MSETPTPSPPGPDETPGIPLSQPVIGPVSGPAAYRRARFFHPCNTGNRLADKVMAFALAVSYTFPRLLRREYLLGDVCAHLNLRTLQSATGLTTGALFRALGYLDEHGYARVELAGDGDRRVFLWLAPKASLRAAA